MRAGLHELPGRREEGLPGRAVFEPLPEEESKLELARRYFEAYGPATVKDAAYFFGVSQAEVRRYLVTAARERA